MNYLINEVQEKIDRYQQIIVLFELAKDYIRINTDKFATLPDATIFESCGVVYIDWNSLSHDQVMKVVIAFGGRWERKPNGDRINYSKLVDGIMLRCYQGQPPPNCQIVYEEYEIPAQPAKTGRRAKMVCKPVDRALPEKVEPVEVPLLTTHPVEDEIPF